YKLGGYGKIFHAAGNALPHKTGPTGKPGALIPGNNAAYGAYATLALGSALALFMYPHVITGVLSAKGRNVIRRNATLLPAYTFLLGLIALLRSEEHTSELQSRENLVCRLLLEKK